MNDIYSYSYLIGTLAIGVFWVHFFFVRPDLRSPMLKLSFLFGIGGVLSEFIYVTDWWSPTTVTGTKVGIEDFLFGFFFSGAVAMCYEVLLKKTHVKRGPYKQYFRFRYIALIISAVFFGSTLIAQLHSFLATVLAFGICTLLILSLRKDLIFNAALSSLFACLLAFVFFGVPEFLTSGWITHAWSMDTLSGGYIFFIPREDFIWFLMAGAFIGPLYKYWKNYHLKQTEGY